MESSPLELQGSPYIIFFKPVLCPGKITELFCCLLTWFICFCFLPGSYRHLSFIRKWNGPTSWSRALDFDLALFGMTYDSGWNRTSMDSFQRGWFLGHPWLSLHFHCRGHKSGNLDPTCYAMWPKGFASKSSFSLKHNTHKNCSDRCSCAYLM